VRRVVVGFSGGVTSAWCAGWAIRNFPREEIILLWHDTKREHPDTYRFLKEMAAALDMPITERSDGRSVIEVFRDEGFLGNSQQAMCSRILKQEQGKKHMLEVRREMVANYTGGVPEILKVLGYSRMEPKRVQAAVAMGWRDGFTARFPMIEENVTKQQATDWCLSLGVKPSAMYCWSEHANCVGCVKGGKAYWLAVLENAPEVFDEMAALEDEFGHTILRGAIESTSRSTRSRLVSSASSARSGRVRRSTSARATAVIEAARCSP